MASTMVIKVKYGDTLRRFNVCVDENEKLDLDIDGLRAKIRSLFNFPQDADLTLTYIDEDGDVVTLVDDDDLHDAMRQRLKFLRIGVQLKDDKYGNSDARSSGRSTPLRSPRVQHMLPDSNIKVSEILKSVPEPLRETVSKLSFDFASKAASSSPVFADLVESFLKICLSQPNVVSQSQSGPESSRQAEASQSHPTPSVPKDANASKDSGLKEVLPKSTSMDLNSKSKVEDAVRNLIGGTGSPVMPLSSSLDLNMVPQNDPVPSGSRTVSLPPAASNISGCDDKKDAKNNHVPLGGKNVGSCASSSCAGPMRPSDVDQPTLVISSNTSNECPFSGIPVANDSGGIYGHPRVSPFKRSINRNALVGMFHKGVRCDGCGVHPITGPRFKSKVKDDYDLCSICFSAMGNETDYIRIDRPVHHRHPRTLKGFYDHRQNFWPGTPVPPLIGTPATPHMLRGCGIKPGLSKLDSCFILDVNVLDGTIMAPSTPFTKIWRMRNAGDLKWPPRTQLAWIGGDKFSDAVRVEIEVPANGIPVEQELDIAVDFTAPELPGRYISYWRMESPSGVKFGQCVWVLIQVDASLKDSVHDSFQGLNLNLPPESNRSSCPELIDMNVQPIVDGGFHEPCNSNSVFKPVQSAVDDQPKTQPEMNFPINEEELVVDEQPKKEQEMNFPINDSLLVGHGGSALAPPPRQAPSTVSYPIIDLPEAAVDEPSHASLPVTPSTVSYPIIDLTEAAVDEPSHASLPVTSLPPSSVYVEISDKDAVELTLLRELEEMGFKQIDLNKEILRRNKYDLQQSVDDLCGVAEWDPILEELLEMGFCDEETNKRLLKKNNGSIKRVVMDLLTGERRIS